MRHGPRPETRKLAIGFAASAQADDQLAALSAWLAGKDPPDGLALDVELWARILFALAARGWRARRTWTRCRGSTLSPAR